MSVPTVINVELTDQWQKLSQDSLTLQTSLALPSANTIDMLIRIDGGAEATWFPGVTAPIGAIDLSRIEVKQATGTGELLLVVAHPVRR